MKSLFEHTKKLAKLKCFVLHASKLIIIFQIFKHSLRTQFTKEGFVKMSEFLKALPDLNEFVLEYDQ